MDEVFCFVLFQFRMLCLDAYPKELPEISLPLVDPVTKNTSIKKEYISKVYLEVANSGRKNFRFVSIKSLIKYKKKKKIES